MFSKDIYDFDEPFAETYTSKCNVCGLEHDLSTQKDDSPEYYTIVYIRCECGNSVKFIIPVG